MEEVKEPRQRRGGRPRVVPPSLVPRVLQLYSQGFGYRAIARELARESGLLVDWSTVRRLVKVAAGSEVNQGQ